MRFLSLVCVLSLFANRSLAQSPVDPAPIKPVQVLSVPEYCEGIVFDHEGNGYISHGKSITKFTPEGKQSIWAVTGGPNGHKILADGTHLVCDLSQRSVLHLTAEGKPLKPASTESDGKPLRGPNDLTLDVPNGGFYFTDPEGSDADKPVGTFHYVDREGKTHQLDGGLAYPNGIVLTPDGKRLLVAESGTNRVLVYDVLGPGRIGERKVFAELPKMDSAKGQINNMPDGMCLDTAGNLYVAHYGMQRVEVLDPTGKLIQQLDGGNLTTSNVAFSGPDMNQLYVTGALKSGTGGLFRLDLDDVKGLKILPAKK